MSPTLLQLLSLYFVSVVQLTSPQPTVDVTEQDSDLCSTSGPAGDVLSVLNQLVTMNSQLQTAVSRLQTTVTELQTTSFRLQRDVAALKTAVMPTNITGT